MARSHRIDSPGQWHHVMNRGIARRVVFDDQRALRQFLASVARSVHRGELELIAYAILPTHYHLLVRSPKGDLSVAMRRIQNEYVRWYNRDQRRDGPLFRGRFNSKLVFSDRYRFNLVRYIDRNATEARIVGELSRYPFASARDYMRRVGPRWLSRGWVESFVCERSGGRTFRPSDYERVFHAMDDVQARDFELRASAQEDAEQELENLVELAPDQVRVWMQRKARMADGTRADRAPALEPRLVAEAVRATARDQNFDDLLSIGDSARELSALLTAGLVRALCRCRWSDIARLSNTSATSTRRLAARHVELVDSHEPYARWACEAARVAVIRTGPGTLSPYPALHPRRGG